MQVRSWSSTTVGRIDAGQKLVQYHSGEDRCRSEAGPVPQLGG